jgi:hypothetical protein
MERIDLVIAALGRLSDARMILWHCRGCSYPDEPATQLDQHMGCSRLSERLLDCNAASHPGTMRDMLG